MSRIKRQWCKILLRHGLCASPTVDQLHQLTADLGLSTHEQAAVLGLFFPLEAHEPTDLDKPETATSRAARVELLYRRRQRGLWLYNGGDIIQGMLDSHVDHAVDGTIARVLDVEDDADQQLKSDLEALDYLDEAPRRAMLKGCSTAVSG